MAHRDGDRGRGRRRAAGIAALVAAAAVSSGGAASASTGMARADAIRAEPTALPGDFTITPSSGPTDGGTTVTISGPDAGRAIVVTFGDATGVLPVVVDQDAITAISPPQDAGNVQVEILFPGGVETVPGGFTYAQSPLAETGSRSTPTSAIAAGALLGVGALAVRWSRAGRR